MTSRPALLRLPMAVPLLAGIFAILLIGALRFAGPLLVPIAVSCLLAFLMRPVVRFLKDRGMSETIGAAFTVFGTVLAVGFVAVILTAPAADWVRRAPAEIGKVEQKVRRLARPFTTIRETAERVEAATGGQPQSTPGTVRVETPGPLRRLGWTTANAIASLLTIIFLTYFLLATGTVFRHKLATVLARESQRDTMEGMLAEIELQISRYLLYNTLISAGVGAATYLLVLLVGLPNPLLWAACAFVLNYIPYLGAVVTLVILGLAALVTFESFSPVLMVLGGFVVINLIEANLVTPTVLGRKLPLNSVAIFVALLFWGWVWGIPGAIMAVPLTVMIQVFCAHVKRLHPVAVMLDSQDAT